MKETDPIMWFEETYCRKCKTQSCKPKGVMVYSEDSIKKLWCALSLDLMLKLNRGAAKELKKKGDK